MQECIIIYSAAFIFRPGTYDEQFHALNALIEAAARANPGFIESSTWFSTDGSRVNATYYWTDLESLKAFSDHPAHLEAKRLYANWYEGYQVVISKVERIYGDGHIESAIGRCSSLSRDA
ncbi:MAG: DUF4188 domain-containing protein [Wenzhouxiangellaceae bacterium]|nr:DUF4188 domain-containing protein [Wenzhouxiangellaceae bacterium]